MDDVVAGLFFGACVAFIMTLRSWGPSGYVVGTVTEVIASCLGDELTMVSARVREEPKP